MVFNSRSVTVSALLFVFLVVLPVTAQSMPQSRDRAVGTTRNQPRQVSNQVSRQETADKPSSVRLVEPPGSDYLSGEANVAVSGNQNPVIRLGLSPNGATIIEFPSSDRLFNIIHGNSNLVTVEESPTKATDHFIIARPGDGFASPVMMANARSVPATSVLVQKQSGLALTFLFYPVQQLSEQAHRVVITYNRNEVVAARRAAGLAVNLDSPAVSEKPRTTSLLVTTPPDQTAPALPSPAAAPAATAGDASDKNTPARTSSRQSFKGVADTADLDTSQHPEKLARKATDPARAASLVLTEATRSPRNFRKWSDTVHGLSLSVSPVREVNKRMQAVVIAVKNTRKKNARIMPDQPRIYLETIDSKGRPLQIEPVRMFAVESTVSGEIIPAGEIQYYAIVYEPQILGARQRLRVAVGQSVAADEPATASLTSR